MPDAQKNLVSATVDEKYRLGKYTFPNPYVETKDKNYRLQVYEAIYSRHLTGRTGFSFSISDEFDRNRMYGNGTQPVDIYQNRLLPNSATQNKTQTQYDSRTKSADNREVSREGWMNVNWEVLSIMPKIKNSFHGMWDNADDDIRCKAIDERSGAEREQMKYMTWVHKMFGDQLEAISTMANIPYMEPEFIPDNDLDLEQYENAGGFKLVHETAIEETTQHTFDISDWTTEIKQRLINDAIDIGVIAAWPYYDEECHKMKFEYADPNPKTFGIQYDDHTGYKNAQYAFQIRWMNIGYLRSKGIKEEDLAKTAKQYCGVYNNPILADWDYYNNYKSNTWLYDDFRVPVLRTRWKDFDTNKKCILQTIQGRKYQDVGFDYVPEEGEEIIDITKQKRYVGNWLIGTDIDYESGLDPCQEQPAELGVIVRRLNTMPLTKVLIPHIDMLNLTWFKFQNAVAQLRVMGYAIDMTMLSNMSLAGGEELSSLKALQIGFTTGILPFVRTRFDGSINSMAASPVVPIPSEMENVLKQLIETFQFHESQIEYYTGINSVALGGMPAPRTGKAVTEVAMTTSSTVIKPIIDLVMNLKLDVANHITKRINVLMKGDEDSRHAYAKVIGFAKVEALKIASQHADYGITVERKPSDADWDSLNRQIEIALQMGRDGVVSLPPDVGIMITQMKSNGYNLRQIAFLVRNELRKAKKEAQQKAKESQEQESQKNQALVQSKLEAQVQAMQAELNKVIQEMNTEWQLKDRHEMVKQGLQNANVSQNNTQTVAQ